MICCSQPSTMVGAANAFMHSLKQDQQVRAQYPFDAEERFNFHFVPRDDRKGISLNEMSPEQKAAAFKLLETCLSGEGYQKTREIIRLEAVLKKLEHREDSDRYRDPGKYFFTIFGVPADDGVWGWRVEGHHVSFNFSARQARLVGGTPGFLGSNPAIVPEGPQKGRQILKQETELGFALLHSFSKQQLKTAIISEDAISEIITFNKRKAVIDHPAGITYGEMSSAQQESFLRLIRVYIHRYTKLFADSMLKDIERAGLSKLQFAWAGSQQPGKAHYYRIQGPTLIIEYDNSQNGANHVHTVLRDLLHDFGGDALLEHYRKEHQ